MLGEKILYKKTTVRSFASYLAYSVHLGYTSKGDGYQTTGIASFR